MQINPLVKLFEAEDIRIIGSVMEPLFSMRNILARVNDQNGDRVVKDMIGSGDLIKEFDPVLGKKVYFFTEDGVYDYLLGCNLPGAQEFNRYVRGLIKKARHECVDSEKLANKILRDDVALRKEFGMPKEQTQSLIDIMNSMSDLIEDYDINDDNEYNTRSGDADPFGLVNKYIRKWRANRHVYGTGKSITDHIAARRYEMETFAYNIWDSGSDGLVELEEFVWKIMDEWLQ